MAKTVVALLIFIVASLFFLSGIYLMGLGSENVPEEKVLVSGQTIFGIQTAVDSSGEGIFFYNSGIIMIALSVLTFLFFLFYVYLIVVQLVKYGYVFD